jgi:hypothetical protein
VARLPATPTVDQILDTYLQHVVEKGGKGQGVVTEVVSGLKVSCKKKLIFFEGPSLIVVLTGVFPKLSWFVAAIPARAGTI